MKFIQGYALVHLLSHVNDSSDSMNIYITLFRTALLKVDWWGGLSPHNVYTWLLAQLAYSHCVIFFTRWIVQHLRYLFSLDYWPCMIWTVSRGLCSVLEVPFYGLMSLLFLKEAPKLPEKIFALSARPGLEVLYRFFGFLVSCCQVFHLHQPRCHFGCILGFFSLVSLCLGGLGIIGGTAPRLLVMS